MSEDKGESESPPTESSETSSSGVRIRIFGRTDVGMVREHNEDNFLIADLSTKNRSMLPEVREHTVGARGTLFAVCDGMGGAAAGEVASQMAVDTIYELVQGAESFKDRDHFAQLLSFAIGEAGARIFLAAKANRAQRGMGTTCTAAGVFGKTLFLGQVGDSRAYMMRNGKCKQITKDQSLVSKLIEAGQLTEAEAETYEHAHIILQALGTADTVSVDLTYVDLCKGDALLLCSDGLSGLVNAEQMREVLATSDDPMECSKRLTELANGAGGHDNVTVIVARFDGDLPEATGDRETVAYAPYIITNPIDLGGNSVKVTAKIKGPDAPPPGKDVKNAVSMRPPAPNSVPPTAVRAASEPGPSLPTDADDPVELPVSSGSGITMWAVLVVMVLLVVGVIWWSTRSESPAATVDAESTATDAATTTPRSGAATIDAASGTSIPAPADIRTVDADGGSSADATATAVSTATDAGAPEAAVRHRRHRVRDASAP